MTANRRKIDLERLEADYRAGTLTVAEIARLHECTPTYVCKMARKLGWSRDLEAKVAAVAKAKLSRLTEDDEAAAISQAADARVAVVLAHRRHVGRLQGIVDSLYSAITKQAKAHTDFELGDEKDKIIAALINPHEIAKTAKNLAETQAKLIAMERQAFNIQDESAPPEQPYEERLKQLMESE